MNNELLHLMNHSLNLTDKMLCECYICKFTMTHSCEITVNTCYVIFN